MNPVLWKIFFRSLFIQGSFNDRRMQNLGFAFTLMPIVRGMKNNENQVRSFLVRHMQRFNTNPNLASAIIGSTAKMEVKQINGTGDEIASFKSALAPPYAAIGDSFFWGALRTFAAVSAVIIAFASSPWSPLAFIFTYGIFYAYVRYQGFRQGYHLGRQGYDFIRYLDMPRATGQLRWLSLFFIAALSVLVIFFCSSHWGSSSSLAVRSGLLLLIVTFYYLIKWGVPTLLIFYLAVVMIFVASIIWS